LRGHMSYDHDDDQLQLEKNDIARGYRIFKRRYKELPWRAAYGLFLMELCRQADMASERLGRYVPHHAPTEEEFREMRRVLRQRKYTNQVEEHRHAKKTP